jgi:hypothetical protein
MVWKKVQVLKKSAPRGIHEILIQIKPATILLPKRISRRRILGKTRSNLQIQVIFKVLTMENKCPLCQNKYIQSK